MLPASKVFDPVLVTLSCVNVSESVFVPDPTDAGSPVLGTMLLEDNHWFVDAENLYKVFVPESTNAAEPAPIMKPVVLVSLVLP